MSDSPFPLPLDASVLIAIAAATGSWDVLDVLDRPIILTSSVLGEVRRGAFGNPGVDTPVPGCMQIWDRTISIPAWLRNIVDEGEASVIALALEQHWPEVGIDEKVGRSTAKTCQLTLTGSLGLLVRAKRVGYLITLNDAIASMRSHGIWIGEEARRAALRAAGEMVGE